MLYENRYLFACGKSYKKSEILEGFSLRAVMSTKTLETKETQVIFLLSEMLIIVDPLIFLLKSYKELPVIALDLCFEIKNKGNGAPP